jgi:hypothetical protein
VNAGKYIHHTDFVKNSKPGIHTLVLLLAFAKVVPALVSLVP